MKKQQETKGAKKANFAKHEKKQKLQKMPKKTNNLITKIKNVAVVTITSIALVNTMLICGAKLGSKDPTTPSLHLATAPKFILSKIAQSTTSEEEQNTINDNSLSNNIQNSSATDNEENNNNSENNISTISSKKTNSIIRRVASANTNSSAYLSSIKIDDNELTGFSSTKFDYEETVTKEQNIISILCINENEKVEASENYDVKTNKKIVKISVTSADGTNSSTYSIKLNNQNVNTYVPSIFVNESSYKNNSIIGEIKNINTSGSSTITVNGVNSSGNTETQEYAIDTIIYDGDLVLDGTTTIDGATLNNNVYEFGSTNDCGTSNSDATKMVVLKVNGNLTINSGVTLTSAKNESGYGGPKGMTIYCTGTITNNGTITMTARGAKAVGQNVYLWQNYDGSYEYIPATGGAGGAGNTWVGNAGATGTNRATGGGGSGGATGTNVLPGGNGSAGTSYSGGTGGGGTYHCAGRGSYQGENGALNGGAGGRGAVRTDRGSNSVYASGGAGNNAGAGSFRNSGGNSYGGTTTCAENGTGGLLVLYSNSFDNNGTISTNGSNINGYRIFGTTRYAGGGASGGGSANIFTNSIINKGNITANGGISSVNTSGITYAVNGSNGGNGSVSLGKTNNVTYTAPENNANLEKIALNTGNIEHSLVNNSEEYTVTLEPDEYKLSIEGVAQETSAYVDGNETIYVPSGETTHNLVVTAPDGKTKKTYTIKIIRKLSTQEEIPYLATIKLDGTTIPGFSQTKFDYEIETDNLNNDISVDCLYYGQKVSMTENYDTNTKVKIITIKVVAGDGTTSATYTIKLINAKAKSYIPTDFYIDKNSNNSINMRNSLYTEISKVTSSGNITLSVRGTDSSGKYETANYDADVIVYDGNLVLDGTTSVSGAKLSNYVYEFGNEDDCGTSTNYAKRMVILKVNGDLTINKGVTLTSIKNSNGYGGPKGFTIYCTGKVINNGTISMTARGAKAIGQNVYLWQNDDCSYEYVPVAGGAGGTGTNSGNGNAGISGIGRATGGGGSGGAGGTNPQKSGDGSDGTSYSGGSGGGGSYHCAGTGSYAGENAYPNGGAGGRGAVRTDYGSNSVYASGGAGNNAGLGSFRNSGGNSYGGTTTCAENGTGGLLVLYSNTLDNEGTINSNGSNINGYRIFGTTRYSGGGSSGGGSVNVFANNIEKNGTINANGGVSNLNPSGITYYVSGSNGGNGTVSLGKISNNNYVETKTNANLGELKLSAGKINHSITEDETEYTIELDPEDYNLKIEGIPQDSSAKVEGNEEIYIPTGETTHQLIVTAADGTTKKTYTLKINRKKSSNTNLKGITVDGKEISDFSASQYNYDISLPYEENLNTTISAIKARDEQTVEGEGTYEIDYNQKLVTLKVTAEDGITTAIYNLFLQRVDTTLLKSCTIKDDDDFGKNFDSNTFDYNYTVTNGVVTLNITATPFDPTCSVKIKGAGYLNEGDNKVTITVSKEGIQSSVYTINVNRAPENETQIYQFPYTGDIQKFIAPVLGYYNLETWGAEGGTSMIDGVVSTSYTGGRVSSRTDFGGHGGYSSGIIKLNAGDILYVCVGGKGQNGQYEKIATGGYNGGGDGADDTESDNDSSGGGGGATHIAKVTGTLDTLSNNLDDILLVAGGGGGACWSTVGGAGGGTSGGSGTYFVGGTQTSGYAFGKGKDGSTLKYVKSHYFGYGGGGGGLYGGYAIATSNENPAGGGGSGYISTSLKDAKTISGTSYIPTYDGKSVTTGNTGNGFAKITLMKDPSNDDLLKQFQISYGTEEHTINIGEQNILDKALSYDDTDYTITVPSDVTKLTFYGIQDHIAATVEGNGTYDIKAGTNKITLKVTAENGDEKSYTLNVKRDASSNSNPDNIKINGIIDAFIKDGTDYGKLKNTATGEETEFDPDIHEYSMTLPARQKKISFEVTKGHDYETVEGDGEYTLQDDDNTFTIKITSEDGTSTSEYTYHIFHDMTGNCLLSELHVTNIDKDIDFEQETLEYYITVPNDTDHLDITAVPESDKATVTIIGNDSLDVGLNEVYVIVNAKNGEQLVYVLHTYRMKSGNTFLKSLKITGVDGDKKDQELTYTPEFNKVYEDYVVETVPNNVTKINISAEVEDATATVSGTGVQNLKSGINMFTLTTTAQDGTNGKYTIKIEREKSANNYLSSLSADEGDFIKENEDGTTEKQNFDKEQNDYKINVSSDIDSLNLHYTREDDTSTVKIEGNNNFVAGNNNVKITVTAENGDERVYTIIVDKAQSSNNNLKALWTDKGKLDPTFNKDTTEYNVEVDNDVENVTVSATKEDLRSTISGTGTYALEVGKNTIEVVVKAENGDEKTYTINVNRKKNSNAYLSSLSLTKGQNTIELKPAFDKNTTEYTAYVPYTYYNINVNAKPEVDTTTISGDGKHDLEQGENTIVVTAIAEDGTTKDYTIKVTRVDPGVDVDKISDEARLSNLALKTGSFTTSFDKDTYTYYTTTEDSSLNLIVTPIEKNATYEIIGNEHFTKGTNEVSIEVTSPSGKVTKTYKIVVTKKASSNNNLEYIKVVGYALSPEFNRSTTYYEVNVPEEIRTVVVTAKAEDETSTITGTGRVSLKPGKNTVNVVVTSESGKVKTYTVVIIKPGSSNNNLINLDVSKGTLSPAFDKDTTSYTVTLPYEENTIDVIANVEDDTATVTGNGNHELVVGDNKIEVKVTAQNGNVKTYTIVVIRNKAVSALLKNLKVKDYDISPKFDSNSFEYAVTVDNEITSLNLTTETVDPDATVEITGNENFKVGYNKVNIKVTSSDGSKVENYIIDVTRQVYANNFLSYITLSSGTLTPKFNKTTLTYTAEVEAETESITIEAEPEISSSTVKGTGTYSLIKGENWFNLVVTSQTGITRTYRVIITRKQSSNNYLKDLKVSVGSQLQEITPTFNKNTLTYEVTVPAGTTVAYIDATPEDENAAVGGAGYVQISSMKTVQKIIVSAENGDERTYTLTINREPSSVCDLADLIPSSGVLEPSFAYDTTDYTLELSNADDYLSFTVSKLDENSTVTGIEKQAVPDGESTRIIVVTAEDGKTFKTYTVKVNRVRTDDARLKELKVKDYEISPEFDKDTYSYTITVPNSKKTFTKDDIETATPIQSGAVVSYDNDLSLSTKVTNSFHVKVLAADGVTKKSYTINIVRTKGSSIKINSLTPSTGTLDPTFSMDTDTYSLTLGNDDDYLSFDVQTEDDQAVVVGNEKQEVPDRESTRTITITAEDGSSTKTYTININRIRTDDARLKELTLNSNYTIDKTFDKDTYEYTVTVPTETLTFAKADVLSAVPLWDTANVTLDDDLNDLEQRTTKPYKITVTSANGTQKVYTLNVHCKIVPDTDAYLKSLATSEGTLEPAFDKEVTNYTITVEGKTDKLTLSAEPESEFAKVQGIGETELEIGNNTKQIIVTAEDGTTKLYQVTIKRRSNDARLKSLKIRNYEFDQEFDKDKYEYTLTVPNDKFQTTAEEFEAKPLYNTTEITNDGTIPLSTLEVNVYHIYTKSEDGTDTRTYTIKITRQKSSDSKLASLAVEGCELTEKFDPNKTEYIAYVPKGTDSFDTSRISYKTRDEYAVATPSTTGSLDLSGGKHKYTISVTSQDGTTTTVYTLNVNYEPSHNAYLSALAVDPGKLDPEFNRDVTTYNVYAGRRQNKLTVTATAEDPYATIESGVGTFDITKEKTQILVKVKAEDGKYRIYILNVTKDMTPLTMISGKITTDNVAGKHTATVYMYKAGTDELVDKVQTNDDGTYSFDIQNEVESTMDIVVQKPGYLDYKVLNVPVKPYTTTTIGDYKMIAGNVVKTTDVTYGVNMSDTTKVNNLIKAYGVQTADDLKKIQEINIDDLTLIKTKYGTITAANKETLEPFDFNGDGVVDDNDTKILKKNYGLFEEIKDYSEL